MLEPVRQFAEARLGDRGEVAAVRRRHAEWAAAWMEHADAGLRSVDEADWAVAVDTELANLRAAHQWALDEDIELASRLIGAMFWYAYWYGPAEVFAWADLTAERLAVDTDRGSPFAPGAHATAALGAWRRGDLQAARALAERGLALGGDDQETKRFAWEALRSALGLLGDYDGALVARDHALGLARSIGDAVHEAHAHIAGALALGYLGRLDHADAELAAATALLNVSDNPTARSFHDYVAGEIRIDVAPDEALPLLRRSRDIARSVGNRFMSGIAGASVVSCAARVGDASTAIGGFADVIDHLQRGAAWPQLWTMIRALIETLARVGQYEDATVLLGALRASERAPAIRGPDAERMRAVIDNLRTHLGAEQSARLEARGARLGDEQAMTFALEATFPRHRVQSAD
jgi:tetratricopeptide (TPR) repeat protein